MKPQTLALSIAVINLVIAGCGSDSDSRSSAATAADLSSCNTINSSNFEKSNPDLNGGKVLLYKTDGTYIDTANVGHLPDMVTFIDQNRLMVANEGEPQDDYIVDDEGSISLIILDDSSNVHNVTTLGFESVLLENEVRIKPDSSAERD